MRRGPAFKGRRQGPVLMGRPCCRSALQTQARALVYAVVVGVSALAAVSARREQRERFRREYQQASRPSPAPRQPVLPAGCKAGCKDVRM